MRRALVVVLLASALKLLDASNTTLFIVLAAVGILAHAGGALVRFGLLDPQAAQVGLDFGQPPRGSGFPFARLGQPRRDWLQA